MLTIISNWRRERSAISQLSRLSDRELSDLGIARRDIQAVARYASAMTRDDVAAVVEPRSVFADRGAGRRAEPANTVYRPTSLAA